jgi:hypothetical protein
VGVVDIHEAVLGQPRFLVAGVQAGSSLDAIIFHDPDDALTRTRQSSYDAHYRPKSALAERPAAGSIGRTMCKNIGVKRRPGRYRRACSVPILIA